MSTGAVDTVTRIQPHAGSLMKIRQIFFPSLGNSLITLTCLALIGAALHPILNWTLFEATFSGNLATCRARPDGACWAFVDAKLRFMVFGFYPAEEHWRPGLAMVIAMAMLVASALPRFWRVGLLWAWAVALAAILILMYGGLFGLPIRETRQWGGLPLTLLLSTLGFAGAFPLGILLALGRRSKMPVIRAVSIGYIELIRGVPLVTVLFMASILFPLLMPEGVNFDKLIRAQIAIILFSAAYLAEIVRGGLQAVPRGQYEAAASLGLGYSAMMRKIILPQALKIVIPALVNNLIGLFKDTTLVIIIGLFDFLTAVKASLTDTAWLGLHIEGYVFAGAVYFIFCFAMSRYGLWLEKRLAPERNR